MQNEHQNLVLTELLRQNLTALLTQAGGTVAPLLPNLRKGQAQCLACHALHTLRPGETPTTTPDAGGAALIQVDELCIDLAAWRVMLQGQPVAVSPTEFRLLACLAQRIGRVVSYDYLLEHIWRCSPKTGDRKVITNCVKRLRQKLGIPADSPKYIVAVPGIGYRLRNQRQLLEEYYV